MGLECQRWLALRREWVSIELSQDLNGMKGIRRSDTGMRPKDPLARGLREAKETNLTHATCSTRHGRVRRGEKLKSSLRCGRRVLQAIAFAASVERERQRVGQ